MAKVNVRRIKSSEIEFKDRLVSIQRVTKVNKGAEPLVSQPLSWLVMKMVLLVMALEKQKR